MLVEGLEHLAVLLEQGDVVRPVADRGLEHLAPPLQVVDLAAGLAEQVGDGASAGGVDLLGEQPDVAVDAHDAVLRLHRTPASTRSSVDLPEPFSPTTPSRSPAPATRPRPSSTRRGPYRTTTSSTTTWGRPVVVPGRVLDMRGAFRRDA